MAGDVPTSRRAVLLAIFIAFGGFTFVTVILCLSFFLAGGGLLSYRLVCLSVIANPPISFVDIGSRFFNQHSVIGFLFGYDMGVISVCTRIPQSP
jgi:uncharacterized protein YneF (UPF0154 family)